VFIRDEKLALTRKAYSSLTLASRLGEHTRCLPEVHTSCHAFEMVANHTRPAGPVPARRHMHTALYTRKTLAAFPRACVERMGITDNIENVWDFGVKYTSRQNYCFLYIRVVILWHV
jgi:hypothetical protein